MAENKATNELVLVFVGKKNGKDKAKNPTKKDVYSLMKKATATTLGIPESALKKSVTELVEIKKGAGAGAIYARPVKGSRGVQWKFHYAQTSTESEKKKNTKAVSVGFPTGTPATVVLAFAGTLSNKPLKIISPRGVTHHLEG